MNEIVAELSWDKTAYAASGVNPLMYCEKCRKTWSPKYKPVPTLTATTNFNSQVILTCPNCSNKIQFYLALHTDTSKVPSAICIAVEPIPATWWDKNG